MKKPETARDRAKARWHENMVPVGVAAANALDASLRLAIKNGKINPKDIKP